jgi:hypothetical protein
LALSPATRRKNVEEKMKEARGGVLFIDEAYWSRQGHHVSPSEAMDQLVEHVGAARVRRRQDRGDSGGLPNEMHSLLASNVGLKSRFNETINFGDWTPVRCAALVLSSLRGGAAPFELRDAAHSTGVLESAFAKLRLRPGWCNAHDAVLMASKIADARDNRVAACVSGDAMCDFMIECADVEMACERLLGVRPAGPVPQLPARPRADDAVADCCSHAPIVQQEQQHAAMTIADDGDGDKEEEVDENEIDDDDDDGEWAKLRAVLEANIEAIKLTMRTVNLNASESASAEQELLRLANFCAKVEAMLASGEVDAANAAICRERNRQAVVKQLRLLGTCVVGFAWKPEGTGFRCEGGGHFMSCEQLGFSTEAQQYMLDDDDDDDE